MTIFDDMEIDAIIIIAFSGRNERPHPDKQAAIDYVAAYYRGQLDLLKKGGFKNE